MANIALSETINNLSLPFQLKDAQKRVIEALLSGQNVFALLPTGYGKSVCFGIFGAIMDKMNPEVGHKVIVVSPLKALMADQVKRWSDFGIPAAAITGDMDSETAMRIRRGEFGLLYMSPEIVLKEPWWGWLKSTADAGQICLLAIDEVHCMCTWGSSFRPEYLNLSKMRGVLSAPVLMLTATATQSMVTQITEAMNLTTTEIIAVVPDRPNIHLAIRRCDTDGFTEEVSWLVQHLQTERKRADKTIVYCRTIGTATEVYGDVMDTLGESAWEGQKSIVELYYSDSARTSQTEILGEFPCTDGTIRCLITTVAFGMGVEIPDVRHVIHWGPSENLLAYWQEVGRCSRDSAPGNAHLYAFPRSTAKNLVDKSMLDLVATETCYRKAILEFLYVKGMDKDTILTGCNRKGCCVFCDKTYL